MFVLLALVLMAGESSLFSPVDVKDLTPRQLKFYEAEKAKKTTVKLEVFRINTDLLKNEKVRVHFQLKDDQSVVQDCDVKESKSGHIVMNRSGTDNVTISVSKSAATGLIYHGKSVYGVTALGDGIVAIVLLDQSKFPKD